MYESTRRQWMGAALGAAALGTLGVQANAQDHLPGAHMRLGLVTYLWAKDWDLPTLIANCEAAKVHGVELRTTHAHGVEPSLTKAERAEVKRRFEDSPVVNVGIGSNERYDNPDPEVVKAAIDATKDFIRLSHDVGGSGVKVKPDTFHEGVPREQTIEQIGVALNELGAYGEGFGQQIRLEVHGGCSELPTIKAIMDVATHTNVAVCWNSNANDLIGEGLEYNFNLVKDRFGETAHIRELSREVDYPFPELFKLFVKMDYAGWLMIETSSEPDDIVAELAKQPALFDQMVAEARAAL